MPKKGGNNPQPDANPDTPEQAADDTGAQAEPATAEPSAQTAEGAGVESDADSDKPEQAAEPLDGLVGLDIVRPVALGNGTRPRGFRMGLCPLIDGGLELDAFKPSEGVTADEAAALKANLHHVRLVPVV